MAKNPIIVPKVDPKAKPKVDPKAKPKVDPKAKPAPKVDPKAKPAKTEKVESGGLTRPQLAKLYGVELDKASKLYNCATIRPFPTLPSKPASKAERSIVDNWDVFQMAFQITDLNGQWEGREEKATGKVRVLYFANPTGKTAKLQKGVEYQSVFIAPEVYRHWLAAIKAVAYHVQNRMLSALLANPVKSQTA